MLHKRFLLILLVCSALVFSADVPSMAWDKAKQINLGPDRNKMTWYIRASRVKVRTFTRNSRKPLLY